MSGNNKVSELPCSSGSKIEGEVEDATGKQLNTSKCIFDHIRSVEEKQTSTTEGTVMSENNFVDEQPGSSNQNNDEMNQDVANQDVNDDLASNSSNLVFWTFKYTPYEHKTTHALYFKETAELLFRKEKEIEKANVYVNTGIAHNLISLHFFKYLRKLTQVVPSNKIIETYLPGQHSTAQASCSFSIIILNQRFFDVEFFVVDIKDKNMILGNDFFNRKLPEVILDVHGPLPPITAYGSHDKVVMNDVKINEVLKLDEVRLDTGCEVNLISQKAFLRAKENMCLCKHGKKHEEKEEEKHVYFSSLAKCLLLKKSCFVNVEIESNEYRSIKFYVVDHIAEDMVLGMDFVLNHEQLTIKYTAGKNDYNFKMNIGVKHPVNGYGAESEIQGTEEEDSCYTKFFNFFSCSLSNDAEGAEEDETAENHGENQEGPELEEKKKVKHTSKEDSLQEVNETTV